MKYIFHFYDKDNNYLYHKEFITNNNNIFCNDNDVIGDAFFLRNNVFLCYFHGQFKLKKCYVYKNVLGFVDLNPLLYSFYSDFINLMESKKLLSSL